MSTERILAEHPGAQVSSSKWRTYLVLAHTLSGSLKLVSRAAIGRLQREDVENIFRRWYGHVFDISKLTLIASGVEHAERAIPCVVVCNHVSLLDTPCVIASFPGSIRFVGKMELRRVPVFGKGMEEAGIVFVDREDRAKAIGQLDRAKKIISEGYSLWVAAEGKRSRDGRLRTFKKGAFHIAVQLGVPIVPAWIQGTLDVIPSDQWRSMTGQTVRVAYGEPVSTQGKTREDLPELMAIVRERMLVLARAAGAPDDVDAGA